MSVSVVITNLTSAPLHINELYTTLGAAGSTTAAVTIARTVAQLDSMNETKSLLYAGSISVVPTESADNADLLSIPLEQHGVATGVSVAAATEVLTVVTFAKPFPTGVKPVVTASIDKSNALTSRAALYVQSISNTGCTLALVVSTTQAATVDLNWVATY
jgi:hypothetical protein